MQIVEKTRNLNKITMKIFPLRLVTEESKHRKWEMLNGVTFVISCSTIFSDF